MSLNLEKHFVVLEHRRIQIFLGGLKDEFIRMCTDCIALKTQLLR